MYRHSGELIEAIKQKEVKLSFSSLKQFGKSPEHFIKHKMRELKPTPAMKFGNLVHAMILEPEKVDEVYVSGIDVPTTENQNSYADYIIKSCEILGIEEPTKKISDDAFSMNYKRGDASKVFNSLLPYIKATLSGKEVVSIDDFKKAEYLKKRVEGNKVSYRILTSMVQTEFRLEWEYAGWGHVGFVDGYTDDDVIDLKVTDADPSKVEKFIYQGMYYVQAAMYMLAMSLNGKPKRNYKILAVDKDGNVSVHRIDDDYLSYGLHQYKLWVQEFERMVLMGTWNSNYDFYGSNKGEYLVKKPNWADMLMEVYEDDKIELAGS